MKRIKDIDILRAIAIILVIVGHTPYPGFNPELHKWIYAFHIPLFFFVSGLSLYFTNYHNLNLKKNFKKRFNRIYLPYLIWSIALALPSISVMTIPKILYGTHQSIASVSNSSLWFLPVLFFATIFLDLILFFSYKKNWQKYLPFLLIIFFLIVLLIPSQSSIQYLLGGHNLPFGIDVVPMAILFMLSGYLFQIHRKTKELKIPILISVPLIILSITILTYFSLHNNTNYVLMAENRYGNYLYFFIAAFSGIIASFLISFTIARHTSKLSKLMQKIGSDTMIIFILHKYPLQLINDLILLIPVAHISNYFIIPLYLIFALIICIPISSLIKKHASILIGKL
ncbi:MAG: acyltransferase family protein [Methanobrevibacter sp.]|nr:acyltransferase family protein [Candidatus Saccharibacteria bacterium]MBQ3476448.1 acyltransferase family protein [Candidatus Saccharibacteria bacterium]MBQ3640868.1 acyltransferase family protein [bacterium]MBQ6351340.1 acyltransferase family protein [Methanobrevibacter sp.]MBR0371501.1 acyltransferase family protein [Methanobrevibacter sp.]